MIELESTTIDSAQLRGAFGCFPSGVTAVCAMVDGEPIGMAASSFTSVSLDPPLVSLCFQSSSSTWRRLRGLERLGISVLAQGQDEICMNLARNTVDRFGSIAWGHTAGGSVFVHGATAWLDCSLHDELPAGDHSLALLEIHGLQSRPTAPPLVFHGSKFRRLAAIAFGGDVADFVAHQE